MNVLWTKRKFHEKNCTENENLHASGDGGAAGRCCRLCGGDTSLRALGATYVWEGVEARYDQLLYDCFGVRVPSLDSLICEWCVRQLRSAVRFRALVLAAFDNPPSSPIPSNSTIAPKVPDEDDLLTDENVGIINNKEIIEMLKTKMTIDNKKRVRRPAEKRAEVKKTNVQCTVCGQKYIMLVTSSESQEFVCSRCKKNDDKQSVSKKQRAGQGGLMSHNRLHVRADSRGKIRQPGQLKKPSQMKKQENPRPRVLNIKCSICPKRYATSEHMVEHMKLVHGERRKTVCVFCGKNCRTNELLNRHIQMHIDLKHFDEHASRMCGVSREKKSV